MTIAVLRKKYQDTLGSLYPVKEVDSMFAILAEDWLGLKPHQLVLEADRRLDQFEQERFESALERLSGSEPLQYITGYTEFWNLHIKVNPDVLIPRPETEELVDLITTVVTKGTGGRLLDIGTGSGCIALALKCGLPDMTVEAVDISPAALEVAKANRERLKLVVDFYQRDILAPWPDPPKVYSVIVSNPPYITRSEIESMEANVVDNEPGQALFVEDRDPLLYYREIAKKGRNILMDGGLLFFEINQRFGGEVVRLLDDMGYSDTELRKDFRGKDRFVSARLIL